MRRIKVIGHGIAESGEIVEVQRSDFRKLLAVARAADKACRTKVLIPMSLAVAVDKMNAKPRERKP